MSFIKNIMSRARNWATDHWPGQLSWFPMPSKGIRLLNADKPAEEVVDIFAALEARNEHIRSVPLRISDDGDNILEGGELYDLFARPNKYMDFTQYVEALESNLALFDFAPVAKVGEPGKNPDELYPLSPRHTKPDWVIHKPTGMRVPLGWVYSDPFTGRQSLWAWDEIIPIVGFNPHNPFTGLSAMTVGQRTIIQDMATREQNIALFTNGGIPDLVLETPDQLTPDQAKERLQRWNDFHRGFNKAHGTALLDKNLKVNKLGLNPEELQAFEALRLTTVDVCKIMRVWPAMLGSMMGETGLSQGSSTQEQILAWWQQVGLGELARIAAAHQAYLVDKYEWQPGKTRKPRWMESVARRYFDGRARGFVRASNKARRLYLWFDLNQIEVLVEHRLKRVEQFGKFRLEGYPPDAINDYLDLGLPPHPTNVGILPFSVQSVEDVGGATSQPTTPSQKALDPKTHAILSELDKVERLLEDAKRASAQKYKSIKKSVDTIRTPMEKQAAKKYSRYFMEQRGRVLDRLKGQRDTRAEADDLTKSALPLSEENEALLKLLGPTMAEQMKLAWDTTTKDVAADATKNPFQVDDPNIQKAIEKRKIQATKINDTTEGDLRKIFADGIDAGLTTTELGDAVANYYSAHVGETSARPMVAARTQVNGIVNDARMERARAVGGLKKGWLHGSPDEPREDHLNAQAKYLNAPIALDESFVVGGVEMDSPGDPSAPASQTANCTCMVVFLEEKK